MNNNLDPVITMIVSALILAIFSTVGFARVLVSEPVEFTVQNQEVVYSGSSRYLIYTKGEVFENTDSTFLMKWNSSDLQNEMQVGKHCKAMAYGYRVPFLSWYRNLNEVVCD